MADIVNLMLKDVSFINQNLWVDDLTLAMCANHLDRGILMKITWFCRNIRIFFLVGHPSPSLPALVNNKPTLLILSVEGSKRLPELQTLLFWLGPFLISNSLLELMYLLGCIL